MPAAPTYPRFNHVALSVAPDLLDDSGRGEILDFYGEVFGWTEMPTLTRDRERDERVELVARKVEDYKVLRLHNFYVRFRLPLLTEVQYYEWASGFDDQRTE